MAKKQSADDAAEGAKKKKPSKKPAAKKVDGAKKPAAKKSPAKKKKPDDVEVQPSLGLDDRHGEPSDDVEEIEDAEVIAETTVDSTIESAPIEIEVVEVEDQPPVLSAEEQELATLY